MSGAKDRWLAEINRPEIAHRRATFGRFLETPKGRAWKRIARLPLRTPGRAWLLQRLRNAPP